MKVRNLLAVCAVVALTAPGAFAAITSGVHIYTTDDYYGGGGRCCGSLKVSNDIGGGAAPVLYQTGVASAGGGIAGTDNMFGPYIMNFVNGGVGAIGNSRLGGGAFNANVVAPYGVGGSGAGTDTYLVDSRFDGTLTNLAGFSQISGNNIYASDNRGSSASELRSYKSDGSFGAVVVATGTNSLSNVVGDVETVKVGASRFIAVAEAKGSDPKISIWRVDGHNPATKLSEVVTLATTSTNTDSTPRIVATHNKVYALQQGAGVQPQVQAYTVDAAGNITEDANSPLVPRPSPNLGQARDIHINPLNGRIAIWGFSGAGPDGEVREFSPNTGDFKGLLAGPTTSPRGTGSQFIITPEPATLGLMVIGSLCMLRRRRRA